MRDSRPGAHVEVIGVEQGARAQGYVAPSGGYVGPAWGYRGVAWDQVGGGCRGFWGGMGCVVVVCGW